MKIRFFGCSPRVFRHALNRSILALGAIAILLLAGCGGGGGSGGGAAGGDGGGGGGVPTTSFTVGGTVNGLTGTGLALQLNGAEILSVSADGAFAFTTSLIDGASYAVTVQTLPSGQVCSVTDGNNVISGSDVASVVVTCAGSGFSVGGATSGLTGSGLVLAISTGETLSISADGAFTFPTLLADGAPFSVTVQTQPSGQTCVVSAGTGTVSGGNITSVAVDCITPTFTIGGTVSGLTESGLVLTLNGLDILLISTDGAFTFTTMLIDGASYLVSVSSQPSGQICTVEAGTGTISGASITDVSVTCVTPPPVGTIDNPFDLGIAPARGTGSAEAFVSSFYKVTTGTGSWQIAIYFMTGSVDLFVYDNPGFSSLVGSSTLSFDPDTVNVVCAAASCVFYIKAGGPFGGSGTFRVDVDTTPVTEGTLLSPVDLGIAPVSRKSSVVEDETSYYVVTVDAGQWNIQLSNMLSVIDVFVYRDAAFSVLRLSTFNFGTDPIGGDVACNIDLAPCQFYIKVRGSFNLSTNFLLEVTQVAATFPAEGTLAAPIDLGAAPATHAGTAFGDYSNSYYRVAVTQGTWEIAVSDIAVIVNVTAFEDAGFSIMAATSSGGSNNFVRVDCGHPACDYFIQVTGPDGIGFSFQLDITLFPTALFSEGNLSLPVDLGVAPLTHQGSVTVHSSSFYTAQAGAGDWIIMVSQISSGGTMEIFDDPGFTNLVDSSSIFNVGTMEVLVTCASAPCQYYIRVTPDDHQEGSFVVDVMTPLSLVDEGTQPSPIDLGPAPATHTGTVTAGGNSFYEVSVTTGTWLFVVSKLITDADLEIYDDAGFSNLVGFSGGDFRSREEEMVDCPTATCIFYIKMTEDSMPAAGASFFIDIRQIQQEGSVATPVDLGAAPASRTSSAQESSSSFYSVTVPNWDCNVVTYRKIGKIEVFV